MPLKTNLISYWKLNEASGDAIDAHGSNTLTANNAPGSATGKIDNCRTFDGANQAFALSHNASLAVGDIDFTIACWVKLNATGSISILSKDAISGGERGYSLDLNTGSRYRFYVFDAAGAFAFVEANNYGSPVTGVWVFVVAWHDSLANTINIQVNNGAVDSLSHSTGVMNSSIPSFTLGSRSDGRYLDGSLDEAGLWKKILTSDERTALFNSGSGKSYDTFDQPLNLTAPVLATDGTVTSGTWDSQSNGTITRTTYLRLASDDSLVATLYTDNPDFSSYVTPGQSYYVIERASNDGGYDAAEDTQSANTTIVGGSSTLGLKLGSTTINKLYLGSTEIKKAYLGNTLIYDKTS